MNFVHEFKRWYRTREQLQREFFLQEKFLNDDSKKVEGEYWYRERGLRAKPGTIVLFQCSGEIIGCAAIAKRQHRFKKVRKHVYRGTLYFEPATIAIISPPVTAREIRTFWPRFRRFNQTRQFLRPPENFYAFRRALARRFRCR